MTRSFRLHVGLLVAGSVLVLWGAGLPWITWQVADSLSVASVDDHRSGAELRPLVRAMGFLSLAGVAALFALRGRARQAFGAVLGLAGGLVVALTWLDGMAYRRSPRLADLADGLCPSGVLSECVSDRHTPLLGPALVLLGAAALLASGLVAARRGGSWRGLGSSYDAPGASTTAAPVTDKAVWDALDRGDDPTS